MGWWGGEMGWDRVEGFLVGTAYVNYLPRWSNNWCYLTSICTASPSPPFASFHFPHANISSRREPRHHLMEAFKNWLWLYNKITLQSCFTISGGDLSNASNPLLDSDTLFYLLSYHSIYNLEESYNLTNEPIMNTWTPTLPTTRKRNVVCDNPAAI